MTASDTVITSAATHGMPSTPPVWDAQAIGNLVGPNQAMQQRILAKFLQTATDSLAGIEAAHAAADLPEVTRLAHSLKSGARSVGAGVLGEYCCALEAAGRAGDLPQCQALVPELPGLFGTVSKLIQAHLQSSAAAGAAGS